MAVVGQRACGGQEGGLGELARGILRRLETGPVALDLLYADGNHDPARCAPGCGFHDTTLTTAEVLSALYASIHRASGPDVIVAGSGTVGHLACGEVHLQRLARSMGYVPSAAARERT